MLTFLLLSSLAFLALVVGGMLVLPLLLLVALIWLVTLPIRFLFHVVFGWLIPGLFSFAGALLGIIVVPLVIVIVTVAIVGALVAAILSLLAPLIPIALLAFGGWIVYRAINPPPAVRT